MFQRIINYIKESRIELRKVIWLSRDAVIQYTIAVIVVSLVLAFFLGGIDFLFSLILTKFIL